jgi:hypothetical protein
MIDMMFPFQIKSPPSGLLAGGLIALLRMQKSKEKAAIG